MFLCRMKWLKLYFCLVSLSSVDNNDDDNNIGDSRKLFVTMGHSTDSVLFQFWKINNVFQIFEIGRNVKLAAQG